MHTDRSSNNMNFILKRLKKLNWFHLVLIILFAEIITAIMNTVMGLLWWGYISSDLIKIGTVDALVAAILVGIPVLYIYARYMESEEELGQKNEALNEYRLNLEKLVSDRTAELSSAFEQLRHEFQERRHAEEALEKSERSKLIYINKMTSLGIIVSGVAHEINNPNNFIMANSKLVSDAWLDAGRVLNDFNTEHPDLAIGGLPYSEARYIIPRLISAITEGSERIRYIVANLREFSKDDVSDSDSHLNVNDAINSTVLLISSQAKKYTDHFSATTAEGIPHVKGSRQQIEQVLLNIIINALQSLDGKDRAVEITSRFDEPEDSAVIEIRDEGAGMDKELLKHITDPFFSTRQDDGGTGLGLSISDSIIKEHGGRLHFASEPGIGTTVSIILPAYHAETERT